MSLLSVNKKGKWVVGGVIAFALIATASTGLAAWVIGQTNGDNETGNITVDTKYEDQNVEIKLNEGLDLKVCFAPNSTDSTKLVRGDGTKTEDLKFTIAGTVLISDDATIEVKKVNVDLYTDNVNLGEYVKWPSTPIGVNGTDDNKTPENLEDDRDYLRYQLDVTSKAFSHEFSFSWGDLSGNVNPCDYFDGSTTEKGYSAAITYMEGLTALAETSQFEIKVTPVVTAKATA